MLSRSLAALRELPAFPAEGFEEEIRSAIAPRNLAGLADPARQGLYPVDLESLVESSELLGLTQEEIRRAVPRLMRQ